MYFRSQAQSLTAIHKLAVGGYTLVCGSTLGFIARLGILAFIAMEIRTPKEEANLVEKFGDKYREYMRRTGRSLPKFSK